MSEYYLKEMYLFESKLRDIGKNRSNLYFHIRTGERPSIPHFHIFNIDIASPAEKRSKKYFECCIQLKHAAYWNHENYHRKIPNNKLKKLIVEFLYSRPPETRGKTVWEFCRDIWLSKYYDKELKNMKEPPDYSKLDTSGI